MHEVLMAILAKQQAQDQMGGCRPGWEDQASKQRSLWIVLPLAEDRELSISARAGERNLHILPIPKISAWKKAAFLLHQTVLLKNSFPASMQTKPRGILTDTFCC